MELEHVGCIAESFVGTGMHLKEISGGSESLGSLGHGGHEAAVATSLASCTAGTLHGVGAVHDDRRCELEHVGDVAEIDHQIVVAEGVAAFCEPYVLGSRVASFLHGVAHMKAGICSTSHTSPAGSACQLS